MAGRETGSVGTAFDVHAGPCVPAVFWHALQQWVPPLFFTSAFLVNVHAALAHLLADIVSAGYGDFNSA